MTTGEASGDGFNTVQTDVLDGRWDLAKAAAMAAVIIASTENAGSFDEQTEVGTVPAACEKLYDLNPGKFAGMPTSEFAEIAEDLAARERALQTARARGEKRDGMLHGIKNSAEERQPIHWQDVVGLVRSTFPMFESREAYDTFAGRVEEIFANVGDSDPYTVNSLFAATAEHATGVVEQRFTVAREHVQELLDAHKPVEETGASAE